MVGAKVDDAAFLPYQLTLGALRIIVSALTCWCTSHPRSTSTRQHLLHNLLPSFLLPLTFLAPSVSATHSETAKLLIYFEITIFAGNQFSNIGCNTIT